MFTSLLLCVLRCLMSQRDLGAQLNDTDGAACWACLGEGWSCNPMHRALPIQGLSQGCIDRGWQHDIGA